MVHYGQAESVLQQRQAVLDVAYQLHPERFVRSAPKPPSFPVKSGSTSRFTSDEKTH
jgi:hypothetical protein